MAPWWLRAGNDDKIWEDKEARRTSDPEAPQDAETPTAHTSAVPAAEARPENEPATAPEASLASETPTDMDADGQEAAHDAENEKMSPTAATESAAGDAADEPPAKRRRRRRRRKSARRPVEAAESTPPQAEDPAREMPVASPEPSPTMDLESPPGVDLLQRGMIYPMPERQSMGDERKIAMFCDFENIALGVRASEIAKLDVHLILERLLEKGKIIVKKAYADWERYSDYKKPFHEAAIELIDIPQKYYSGKNSADIKMVVDAMDLCYSKEHLDTFVLVSGDSDFSPLVSKLKENNKYVIGVGVKNSSSSLLIDNCDEFIFYEDLWRDVQRAARVDNLSPKDAEVFGLLIDAMFALNRENKEVLWGSMIKQTMQRKRPSFNEGYYGYSSFSELLEDAQRKSVIRLKRDQRSGNYVVTSLDKRR